jgi:hypothetical protein
MLGSRLLALSVRAALFPGRSDRGSMAPMPDLRIPNRFESLQETFGQEIRPLIVPIDADLNALNGLADRARVQNGGVLCFLLGSSGVGKTTSAHSAAVHMPDAFAPVLAVPPEIALRDVGGWLTTNLPPPSAAKSLIALFDGRELSDDDAGVKQLLSSLNQLLRRRPDLLFCWPTTDPDWHSKLRSLAEGIGGSNFAPSESDVEVTGPPAGEWPTALERLLLQFGKTYEDVGLAHDLVGELCASEKTIGGFLTRVGAIIAERVTKTRVTKRLPQLVFVISSSGDVIGEANRIRRAGTQALAPEPLLGYSPRSEAGKWWTERNKNSNHHLGYLISLFDARLITLGASAVVYACMHSGDNLLTIAATDKGARPDKGNAKRTIEVSEFFRFLRGEAIPEFTSGRKGSILDSTTNAYAAIQALSAQRHKSINRAICQLTREHMSELTFEDKDFEVVQGGNVITDAVVRYTERSFSLEFHHLSQPQCGAANMASYIMDKIRTYAWHHQLIPR